MVLDPENARKNQRMGDKGDESVPLQKQKMGHGLIITREPENYGYR